MLAANLGVVIVVFLLQAEQRLLGRVRAADQKLVEAQHTIADLSDRLRRARYEAKVCPPPPPAIPTTCVLARAC